MEEVENIKMRLLKNEKDFAMREPISEAEYQMKRKVCIGFYDCLMPRLKIKKKPTHKTKSKEDDSDSDYFGDLIVENDQLKAQMEEKEQQIIDKNKIIK